jgi:uncharacterized membrane protein
MPDQIAIHWGLEGSADGYGSKFVGLFLVPIFSALLYPFMYALPKLDPAKGLVRFRGSYDWFVFGFLVYMAYVHFLGIVWNLGWRFSFIRLLAPAIGLLFMGIGVLLREARLNWFLGIRTPWTLSSEVVWNRTHDIGGKLFIVSGALASLGALLDGWFSLLLIVAPGILSGIYLFIYSYREYTKLNVIDD